MKPLLSARTLLLSNSGNSHLRTLLFEHETMDILVDKSAEIKRNSAIDAANIRSHMSRTDHRLIYCVCS